MPTNRPPVLPPVHPIQGRAAAPHVQAAVAQAKPAGPVSAKAPAAHVQAATRAIALPPVRHAQRAPAPQSPRPAGPVTPVIPTSSRLPTVQRKTAPRPAGGRVVQGFLAETEHGLVETRNGQTFTWIAEDAVVDENGDAFWYLDSHQYKNMFGGYYDPCRGITLQDAGNGWYSHLGAYYWYDGTHYQAYQPPQEPVQSNISTPAPSNSNNNNDGGGGKSNADFRRLLLGGSSARAVNPLQAMYGRVASAPTLTGKLNQLEREALASDEALEAAIEELATGNHMMRSTLRGLASRFTDARYDELHSGHGHAEWRTYQLFARLLALWVRKGKKPKEDWIKIDAACRKHGFDKDSEDRGGGKGGGSLRGSTNAPKSKLGGFFG